MKEFFEKMFYILLLIVVFAVFGLLFASCGSSGGALLTKTVPIDGQDGYNGSDGINGEDGYSSFIFMSEKQEMEACGAHGFVVTSCLDVNRDYNCSTDDDNLQSRLVCDGIDGQDGIDGVDASNPVYMNPCGEQGDYDEILIKFINSDTRTMTVVASFSDTLGGARTRLTVIPCDDTHFVTTDYSHEGRCEFALNSNCEFSYEETY